MANLVNVFVGVTQGAVLDIDPDDARLMPGEKTFKTMMEVSKVKGIPEKERERMLKRAAAADRRDTQKLDEPVRTPF